MRNFIKVMKAMLDSNRVKIIKLLQRPILNAFPVLKATELVQYTTNMYIKIPECASLIGNLRFWIEGDPEVKHWLPGIRPEIIG